jgi:hypothetical protein
MSLIGFFHPSLAGFNKTLGWPLKPEAQAKGLMA